MTGKGLRRNNPEQYFRRAGLDTGKRDLTMNDGTGRSDRTAAGRELLEGAQFTFSHAPEKALRYDLAATSRTKGDRRAVIHDGTTFEDDPVDFDQGIVHDIRTHDEDGCLVGEVCVPGLRGVDSQLGRKSRVGGQAGAQAGPGKPGCDLLGPGMVSHHEQGEQREREQQARQKRDDDTERRGGLSIEVQGGGGSSGGHARVVSLYEREGRMTTSQPEPDLSVVVPAYNEEGNIGPVVREASAFLRRLGLRYEIDVVDDGSLDGTARVLEVLQRSDPAVRVIRHRRNLGYGAAVRSGLFRARGRHVLLIDGDGQFRIDTLADVWPVRTHADLVLGYRRPRRDPPWRRAAGWLYSRVFVRLLFGGGFRDVNCGFKLIARRVLDEIELSADGALVSAELLTRARRLGASWIEVPVDHFPRRRGKATGLLPRVLFTVLREARMVRREALADRKAPAAGLRPGYDALESTLL